MGYQLDYYIYDMNFRKKKLFSLLEEYGEYKNSLSVKTSENWTSYTHQYTNLICRRSNDGEKVYLNIYSEHPDFNYLENTNNYLERCYHILELDINKEKTSKMYARGYPPVYSSNSKNYVIFSAINFDIDNENCFYVSYEADSLIYKYDSQYNPLYSFGYSGTDMNMNFKKINNYEDCRKYFRQERMDKGYYSWVEYIDETELLFRSYTKGNHNLHDGLQIYSGSLLLADLSVPKGLKVVGYVAPYYYSQAIAEEEEELLLVYRFKLD